MLVWLLLRTVELIASLVPIPAELLVWLLLFTVELIASLGVDSIHRHNVGLANQFCQRMGLPPSNSAIVSLDGVENAQGLKDAGIAASIRAGSLRLSFHLYNGEKDVDAVVSAIS